MMNFVLTAMEGFYQLHCESTSDIEVDWVYQDNTDFYKEPFRKHYWGWRLFDFRQRILGTHPL